MIRDTFQNSGELARGVFEPFYGKYREENIRTKIFAGSDIPSNLEESYIEFSIYDGEYSLQHWKRSQDYQLNTGIFDVDVKADIEEADVPDAGNYILRYNFFIPQIGYQDNGIYVKSVSDDRREARIRVKSNPPDLFQYSVNRLFSNSPEPMRFVANFGRNAYEHIVNWNLIVQRDQTGDVLLDINGNPTAKEAVIRFEEPLSATVSRGDDFWIDEEASRPYFDRFQIFRSQPVDVDNELAEPNFSVDFGRASQPQNKFESFEDIVEKNKKKTSRSFIESRISGSEKIELNVDFTDFENFIQYSSAEERLKNFRFKIKKINQNVSEINSQQNLIYEDRLKSKIESLIGSFDAYEKFLLREGYPKNDSGGLKPAIEPERSDFDSMSKYKQKLSEHEDVNEWFRQKFNEAASYDDSNDSALRKQVPEFVRENPENDEFVLFVDMIGHWFDVNWIYIKHLKYLSSSREDPLEPETLSADLSNVVAESFGFETYNGFDAESFFDEIFDSDKIENLFEDANVETERKIENGIIGLTRFQAQRQIWRRLLQNVVQFYKKKGTPFSIDSLLSIFGIPTNSLIIRESGGARLENQERVKLEEQSEYLSFSSSQEVEIPWKNDSTQNPKSVELRFKTGFQGGQSLKVFEVEGVIEVRLVKDELNVSEGKLEFSIISADGSRQTVESFKHPFFNGEWTNLLIQPREDDPFIDIAVQQRSPFGNKRFEEELSAVVNQQTKSNFSGAAAAYVGGRVEQNRLFSEGIPFIGDVDQINVWDTQISKDQFDRHTFVPKAYDQDLRQFINVDLKQSFQETLIQDLDYFRERLIFRGEFSSEFPDVVKNFSSKKGTENLEGTLRTDGKYRRFNRISFINPIQVGSTSFITSKISSSNRENGETELRLEKTVNPTKENKISEDSANLGVFFSPNTVTNRDAIFEIGLDSINKTLGNPDDQFRESYYTLDDLNRLYWEKYDEPKNIQRYINYVDQFYSALFKHIQKAIPVRAADSTGIVIEPSILERDKYKLPTGSITDNT